MQTSSTSIGGGLTVEEAFARVLQNNLSSINDWAPIALAGEDIEGVHQMRVCLRRMRSALTVFRAAIPKRATKGFSKEMRWAAKTLDRARDLDVYITESLASKKKQNQRKLRKIAERHRKKAYRSVEDLIKGKRYTELCDGFNQWVGTKSWRDNLSEHEKKQLQENITPFASRVLEEHRSHILEFGEEIDHLDSEALHQLRIECKKLRYATEFFSSLYGEEMQSFTGRLRNLQNLLGTLHDTAVMTGLQKDLLKDTKNKKVAGVTRSLERKKNKQAEKILKKTSNRWRAFAEAERPWITPSRAAA